MVSKYLTPIIFHIFSIPNYRLSKFYVKAESVLPLLPGKYGAFCIHNECWQL